MLMPLLSAKDPTVSAEGTIDPLGLYLIADALGVKLIPGVRERMSHPRFWTLAAVSAALCNEYDEEVFTQKRGQVLQSNIVRQGKWAGAFSCRGAYPYSPE